MDLKLAEKEYLLGQFRSLVKTAGRQLEQNSMQIQGEIFEIAVEDYLKSQFPLDSVIPIGKGIKGGDAIHTINSRNKVKCGTILYESKNTKAFSNSWVEKIKADMLDKAIDIGVIVTNTYPKDMVRMGQRDEVWICSMEEFKALCFVLRETILMISRNDSAQQRRSSKKDLLYDFFSGTEYRMQVQSIVQAIVQMSEDLNAERRAMEAIWAKRRKQLEKITLNTTHSFASIEGIVGDSIVPIEALQINESTNAKKSA